MKRKIDLINFLRKYNLQNCNKKFTRKEAESMDDHDLECFIALCTYQATDNLDHSLENADLKMKMDKKEMIDQFFTKEKEN